MLKKVISNHQDKVVRADVLLADAYPEYSRAALAKLFELGDVKQGKELAKAGDKIKPGHKITTDISALTKPAAVIDLPVIYEDANVVVVDKPVGVISHARGRYFDEPSVASFIRGRVSELSGERAGIVHRLDRATSGVMICAKNPATMRLLQGQFSKRQTKKSYYAIIKGTLEPQSAVVEVPLARNPKKPQTFKPDANGKQASTNYEVVKSNADYSLIKLTPKTGRTHQLRVHLKHLHHPIVGDTLYGGQPAERLFLHAHSLEITLPGGIRKVFISKLPKSFNKLIK
jgi:23S rRNA pseudouridine1911/1915/1917 synthase